MTLHALANRVADQSFEYIASSVEDFLYDIRSIKKIAYIALDLLRLTLVVPMAVVSLTFGVIAKCTAPKKNCSRLITAVPAKISPIGIATWNVNGIPGSWFLDRTAPFRKRVQRVADEILRLDTAVVFVQEAYGNSGHRLRGRLKSHFHAIVDRTIKPIIGLDSGLACYSHVEIKDYIYVPYKKDRDDRPCMSHGFLMVVTEKMIYVGTHLSAGGAEKRGLRKRQFQQIKDFTEKYKADNQFDLGVCIAGDLNLGKGNPVMLDEYTDLGLQDYDLGSIADETTCSDELKAGDKAMRTREDYILSYPSLLEGQYSTLPQCKLSDHRTVVFQGV